MFSDIDFQFFGASYLFLIIPLLLGFFWSLHLYRIRALNTFGNPSLVHNLLIHHSKIRRINIIICLILTWVFATLAIMGPKGNPHYIQERELWEVTSTSSKEQVHELILLIDTSQSMSVRDTRKKISRLSYAQEIADMIVSKSNGEIVSVYAFTSELIPVVPPTLDYLFTRLMIRNLKINEGNSAGTDFQKTLTELQKHLENDNPKMLKTIVILSDGEDTHLDDVPPLIKGRIERGIEKSVEELIKNNTHILTIAIGTRKGGTIPDFTHNGKSIYSNVNEELLKLIAKIGEGELYISNDETPLGLAAEVQAKIQDKKKGKKRAIPLFQTTSSDLSITTPVYNFYFQIPLAIAILFLSLSLLIPEARRKGENV